MKSSVFYCSIIKLPKLANPAGNISVIEKETGFPFEIKRVFYIYDIPGGEDRGAHAHKECHQFIIAGSGAFEVEVNDGVLSKTFSLNQPYYGLHIPPGIWAAEKNFSSGAICLVMTSHKYIESDYVMDYSEYLRLVNK